MKARGLAAALGVVTLLWTGAALAHPYHVSIATAHHRPEEGRLEVSLRLTPEDLDAELERRLGRPIDLDAAPFDPDSEVDRELSRMLRDDFRVTGAEGIRYGVHLVGREVELEHAWVYFEVAVPPKLDGLTLLVRLLFELEASQENTVNLVDADGRRTLLFRSGDGPEPL